MHSQYHGCWCPGDPRSQGISNIGPYIFQNIFGFQHQKVTTSNSQPAPITTGRLRGTDFVIDRSRLWSWEREIEREIEILRRERKTQTEPWSVANKYIALFFVLYTYETVASPPVVWWGRPWVPSSWNPRHGRLASVDEWCHRTTCLPHLVKQQQTSHVTCQLHCTCNFKFLSIFFPKNSEKASP